MLAQRCSVCKCVGKRAERPRLLRGPVPPHSPPLWVPVQCPPPSLTYRDSGQVPPLLVVQQTLGTTPSQTCRQTGKCAGSSVNTGPSSTVASPTIHNPAPQSSYFFVRPQAPDQDTLQAVWVTGTPPLKATRPTPTPLCGGQYFLLASERVGILRNLSTFQSHTAPPTSDPISGSKMGGGHRRGAWRRRRGHLPGPPSPPAHAARVPGGTPHPSRDPLLSSPSLLLPGPSPTHFHPCPGHKQRPPPF